MEMDVARTTRVKCSQPNLFFPNCENRIYILGSPPCVKKWGNGASIIISEPIATPRCDIRNQACAHWPWIMMAEIWPPHFKRSRKLDLPRRCAKRCRRRSRTPLSSLVIQTQRLKLACIPENSTGVRALGWDPAISLPIGGSLEPSTSLCSSFERTRNESSSRAVESSRKAVGESCQELSALDSHTRTEAG